MGPRRPPVWLWVLPVFSAGWLSLPSAITVAGKRGRPLDWAVVAFSSILTFISFFVAPTITIGGAVLFANLLNMVGVMTYVSLEAPKAKWGPTPYAMLGPGAQNEFVLEQAEAARKRRHEAAQLAHNDPGLARQLRIGRPDLPRQYDDGGLVDINSLTAPGLAWALELSKEQAESIVAARQELGRFTEPDDLWRVGGLDIGTYDAIADRLIVY